MATLITRTEWREMLGFCQAMARRYAAGIRSLGEGKTERTAPCADWIRSGVERCGRPHASGPIDKTGRKRVWSADGSVVQDAVQAAMLTTYRQHLNEPETTLDELRKASARRAQWHLRTWDEKPNRFIPGKMQRYAVGAVESLGEHQEEVAAMVAPGAELAEVDGEELARLLALLPETYRRHALALIEWVAATGLSAGSDECPVDRTIQLRLRAEIDLVVRAR